MFVKMVIEKKRGQSQAK